MLVWELKFIVLLNLSFFAFKMGKMAGNSSCKE